MVVQKCFSSFYFSAELMTNKQNEEHQCRVGTADLAEALLDSLSTGVKISVIFVVVVVFSFF